MNTIDARTLNQQMQYGLRKQVVRHRKKRLDNKAIYPKLSVSAKATSVLFVKSTRVAALTPSIRGFVAVGMVQRELDAAQEVGIQKLQVDKTQDQLKLAFALWPMDSRSCSLGHQTNLRSRSSTSDHL
jgi:hypothetical protein